jgi:hypothetical protein
MQRCDVGTKANYLAETEAGYIADMQRCDVGMDENDDYEVPAKVTGEEAVVEEDDGHGQTLFAMNSTGCEIYASHMDEGFLTTRDELCEAHGGKCDIRFGVERVWGVDISGNKIHIGNIVIRP